jgi:hypothetical protein
MVEKLVELSRGLFLFSFKFELCGCSYNSHWRLTWSLTSGPVRLVEVHTNWSGYPH